MMHVRPDEIADPRRWFCAAVLPLQEQAVARRLAAAGYEAFAPEGVRVLAPKGARRRAVERREPLFRGYLFVRLPAPVPREAWSAIHRTDGCLRLLSTISGPCALPVGFVEGLREAGPTRLSAVPARHRFRKGQRARITAGPFAGFLGMVSRAESDKRIHLLLRMLGAERSVVLPVSVLELDG